MAASEDKPDPLQWQQFEQEVAQVLADMDPNAQVEYNASAWSPQRR